ncbi:MAG: carboxypeptidase regulatory-like domain-containing protein [Acidobacteria bacterium]|nr:carboxypeptidase regulatory-like domain-containing protein [Acidobacteriota bacterium]
MKFNQLSMIALLTLSVGIPAAAQVSTGRIEITAVDGTGAVLSGVLVEVTGPQHDTRVTGPDGAARFLSLAPGTYQITASLSGFADYVNASVSVAAGGNVQLKAALAIGGLREKVEVAARTLVIDRNKIATSTSVTLDELQNIPLARDPWIVLQTVPGVIVDRVNVGGSESGQQSAYQAKGAPSGDNTWNLDGIPITDMAATGSTPTYYDFDMFQEMNVTTGGSDMSSATGGVALNFILRSGSNTPRGSARIYYESQSMQGNNMPAVLATALGSPDGNGNRIKKYLDTGFESGFPIVRDRLWMWGSMGRTDVDTLTIRQTPDDTSLTNWATKIPGQATGNVRASFLWFHGDKQAFGRNASATRPPETTVNQTGPSNFYKGEVNVVVNSDLFLTVRGSHMPSRFDLVPQGGMNRDVYYDDSGVWHGSSWDYHTNRPQQVMMAEGSYFRGSHELKFGVSWRRATAETTSEVSSSNGKSIVSYYNGYPDIFVTVESPFASNARAKYISGWIGDTVTSRRATIMVGLRYDHQADGTLQTSEPAVPGFERWLPAITAPAVADAITWNSFSPRLGITYALDDERRMQLRASFARFASQLGNGTSSVISPVQDRYIAFRAVDLNRNGVADPGEIDTSSLAGWGGFDPATLMARNQLGSYGVPTIDEFVAGIDRTLFSNVGISASFTYRRFTNFNWTPYIGLRSPAYTLAGTLTGGPLPDGSRFSVPYYSVLAANVPVSAQTGGVEYTRRDGYHQRYLGFEASATKRLSNRWMARVGFSTNDHREYFDDPATAIGDPTPSPGEPLVNGGLVVTASAGSGKSGIYQILPRYQWVANGLYQARWGIHAGFNMVMRQGFSRPWFRSSVTATGDYFSSSKSVLLLKDVGANRLPTVTSIDARIGKEFKIQKVSVNIDLDVFNLVNAGTVLGSQYDYRLSGVTGFGQVLEIMNPRILRLGMRIGL